MILFGDQCVISFQINRILANTNPKKNDQTKIGWVSSRCVMTFEKVRTLTPIPEISAKRKFPLIAPQVAFMPFCFKCLITSKLILLMLLINS